MVNNIYKGIEDAVNVVVVENPLITEEELVLACEKIVKQEIERCRQVREEEIEQARNDALFALDCWLDTLREYGAPVKVTSKEFRGIMEQALKQVEQGSTRVKVKPKAEPNEIADDIIKEYLKRWKN